MIAGTDLASPMPTTTSPDVPTELAEAIEALRELARRGTLAATVAAATPAERRLLTGAAYALAAPIVYQRVTRRVEQHRGHLDCARSADLLDGDCRDRYHDDVESVVDFLLTRSTKPIERVEAWLSGCLRAAIVNGHRKRRGERGAQQRPRLSAWLARALSHDEWLTTLAVHVLQWVGVPGTAGTGTWPLEAWVVRRAEVTGDWVGSDPATVLAEIDVVLAALRSRPQWYARYVEQPLSRKQVPLAPAPAAGTEHEPLSLTEPDAAEEAHLRALAAQALTELRRRLSRGEDPQKVVVEVVNEAFASDTGHYELDRPPHAVLPYEERVQRLLAEPAEVRRIADTVLAIVVSD